MKAKKDYSETKMSFNLFFSKDNKVQTIVFVYNAMLDKGAEKYFTYSPDDVSELLKLKKEIQPPEFSEDIYEAQEQLRQYSQLLKSKLKDGI